ncbi:MAG: helix-turn-helix transcriptional regulator [Sulfurospirillum sp.]|nr:helix-turn-helix transcriptional regulator [Sulfurospirillum sp.]MBL0703309.1 helix-turn-helix transcriptional regulator [Sulfurospirillum sp.]
MNNFLIIAGAINDETRLKILKFIDGASEVCVCDIERSFNMIQSRISRHLKILKDAGFLKVDRRGRWAHYTIYNPLGKFKQDILDEINSLDIEVPKYLSSCKNKNTNNKDKTTCG